MKIAYLGLGANLPSPQGEPPDTLVAALKALALRGVALKAVSALYHSPAWPPSDQPDFVNLVVAVQAGDTPQRLLATCLDVERRFGRIRGGRWAPRPLDIDILDWAGAVQPEPERWRVAASEPGAGAGSEALIVPHPRLHQRAFVLRPLAEIAPAWRHPVFLRSVSALLEALPDTETAYRTAMPTPSLWALQHRLGTV